MVQILNGNWKPGAKMLFEWYLNTKPVFQIEKMADCATWICTRQISVQKYECFLGFRWSMLPHVVPILGRTYHNSKTFKCQTNTGPFGIQPLFDHLNTDRTRSVFRSPLYASTRYLFLRSLRDQCRWKDPLKPTPKVFRRKKTTKSSLANPAKKMTMIHTCSS